MSTLSVRLPDSLHRRVAELAKRDNVSINQFITAAIVEKASTLAAAEYLSERGARGKRKTFDKVLAKVRGLQPEERDRLPSAARRRNGAGPSGKRARRS